LASIYIKYSGEQINFVYLFHNFFIFHPDLVKLRIRIVIKPENIRTSPIIV